MMAMRRCGAFLALVIGLGGASVTQARTLDLAFLPPPVDAHDICQQARDTLVNDFEIEGQAEELTDRLRILYLKRDIRRLQAEDADRWFYFIDTLIARLAEVDENFAGLDALLARISLYIDAGRLDDLRALGLIDALRARGEELTSEARLVLAQYYLSGIGVARDPAVGHGLILEAAYGGSANALLQLARLDVLGTPVAGWDAPLDLTVTMAFGGLLGQINATVCRRAERIAQEYLDGTLVTANPDIALAWFRFAADLGSATGAWRVVQHHLNADDPVKDNAEMLRYLNLAVARGIAITDSQADALKSTGALDATELRRILGFNQSQGDTRHRPSLSPLLQMAVNIDGLEADEDDSPYMQYLRELLELPDAPGFVHTALAKSVLVRRGRWQGEGEAMALLETAVRLGDGEGTRLLGKMLVRYRDDPRQLSRAINLLGLAVERYGLMQPMNDLDTLYRCQANDAPRLSEAQPWARSYAASLDRTVAVSATDLIALDPFKEPLTVAQIQTQALTGRIQALADHLQRVQIDRFARPEAGALWADRLDNSDQGLESFAELEFELATTPFERSRAVELFRRVYLNNGVTTALDLAIALVEDNAKHPDIAAEILDLLVRAGNRGEGAAIRLRARLLAPKVPARTVFEEYAQIIEKRGDFLALLFALPFVSDAVAEDYFDRAVSLMTCGTKDVAELGDARALRDDSDLSYHWQRISLVIEGGHVLSKLRLSDLQMQVFAKGAAPSAQDVYRRALAEGNDTARRSLFRLTADSDLESYDPAVAAGHLAALAQGAQVGDAVWALGQYRRAAPAVQAAADALFDIADLYRRAAETGDTRAKVDQALLLRDRARVPADLAASAALLIEAAEAGNGVAMLELGQVMGFGIGVARDVRGALGWLDRAAQLGQADAPALAALLRLGVAP